MFNIKEIRKRIEHIKTLKHDIEVSHMEEDSLLADTTQAIASGEHTEPAQELAQEVIKVYDLGHERWYA